MKRPFLWVFGVFLLFLSLHFFFYGDALEKKQNPFSLQDGETLAVRALGTLENIEKKPNSYYFYFREVTILSEKERKKVHAKHLLVVTEFLRKNPFSPGNIIEISGNLQTFQSPTNPGGFDEKAYFKEKNIFYRIRAKALSIRKSSTWPFRNKLLRLKERLLNVYDASLSNEDSGIISAMLLGEKSDLPAEMKELYRAGGISHLLAISGMHISILCMVFYRSLSILRIPGKIPFFLTAFFLLCYGFMTGFHISTSRAVIMMLLFLLSREVRRSYDPLTGIALSAWIILLQTPYALFSSGFLLSFSAVFGVLFLSPAMRCFFCGTIFEQEKRKRRERRRQRDMEENFPIPCLVRGYFFLKHILLSSLLQSICVNIATLPVLAHFYYEIPVYGIFLNVIVLPFASVLVVAAILGGVMGLFFLPLAKLFLVPVHFILTFYRTCCEGFLNLPEPIHILGCPSLLQSLGYLFSLLLLLFFYTKKWKERERLSVPARVFFLCTLCLAFVILIHRPRIKGFSYTMLDVGQGDGMVLQTESGHTILIDGGSTSVSDVGKYRILPFLKYSGIRHIDYMIMTHEDEDHISGQLELLEGLGKNGLSVGTCLFPEPSKNAVGENFKKLWKAAEKAGVPPRFIHTGDFLTLGALRLFCIHPEKGFETDSANAYSTTLLLFYRNFSMLLTGDLEKNGEDAVMEQLKKQKAGNGLTSLTVLKVAHHGSKNSTREEMLYLLSPKLGIISCGRNNRYGHPHEELLKRLEKAGTKVLRTDQGGAILIQSDGKNWTAKSFS